MEGEFYKKTIFCKEFVLLIFVIKKEKGSKVLMLMRYNDNGKD